MAVKSGWFNSVRTVDPQTGEVSFDRTYDNETMNSFLKGLISTNGIFSNVGTHPLKVIYASDLTVTVNPGKAMLKKSLTCLAFTLKILSSGFLFFIHFLFESLRLGSGR